MPGRHPIVVALGELMEESKISGVWLCWKAGIAQGSVTRWRRRGHVPNLSAMDAALQVLGYELTIAKRKPARSRSAPPTAP